MSLTQTTAGSPVHFPADPGKFEFDAEGGGVYGRLTVIRRDGSIYGSKPAWLCVCSCGETIRVARYSVQKGDTRSCGCLARETLVARQRTHGKSNTPEYVVWRGMLERCNNPDAPSYQRYGGSGVRVDPRWLSFENFLADMGARPAGTSLERVNGGDYGPGRCTWATAVQQARNTKTNHRVWFRRKMRTLAEVAELTGVPYKTLWARVSSLGWTLTRAITAPIRGHHG